MNTDKKYEQLLHNIETLTQMVFDGYESKSNCTPQILLKDGVPSGFRMEERLSKNHVQETDQVAVLKGLVKSGYGNVKMLVQDGNIVCFIVEETIKAVL